MNLNYFLIWAISLSCTVSLGRLLFFAVNPSRGWITIYAFILVITLGLLYIVPTSAGLIGGLLWGVFLLLPSISLTKINQLRSQQRYREAYKIANCVRWLHPADGLMEEPKFLLALSLGKQGKVVEAESILSSIRKVRRELACQTSVFLYSMQADWQRCLETIQTQVSYKTIFHNQYFTIYYLRSLGETGQINDLIQGVGLCEQPLEKAGDWQTFNFLRLMALAFAGKKAEVRQLFDTVLSDYPADVQRFWYLTAVMSHQDSDIVHSELRHLQQGSDWILNQAIDWRLNHSPSDHQPLSSLSQQILGHLQQQLAEDRIEDQLLVFQLQPAYVTYSLMAANLVFFILETVRGGSENLKVLHSLGALVPQAVVEGDWWRLLTANFLHFGWLHLATNMLGIYFLGPFVEANLGRRRYLFLYLLTGLITMLILTWLGIKTGRETQTLVGASAAIMGLFGCVCAIFVKIYRQGRYDFALKRLRLILLVLGFQFLFDSVTPQVSFLSHLLGLILGFSLGMFLLSRK